jgi:hypothetical protein
LVEWPGEIGSGMIKSSNSMAQVVEKSTFGEGKSIWFLLRRAWFLLRKIWFLLRPALILLRWIWISSPRDREALAGHRYGVNRLLV